MRADRPRLDRTETQRRWESLRTERSSWIQHWWDISRHISPRTGRFLASNANHGGKKDQLVLDSTAAAAKDILSAGMLAGMTSPARPWFRLETPDEELNDFHSVKVWLAKVTRMMQTVFAQSNTYRALRNAYGELGTYGNYAGLLMPRFETVIHHHPFTAGQFCFAMDEYGEIDTLFREFELTVAETVKMFGYENCRSATQRQWDTGNYEHRITIIHGIEPRRDRDLTSPAARDMPFASTYVEQGAERDKVLRESGFKFFRGLCPRWYTNPGDTYASDCPGMKTLGDVKQLMHAQMMKGIAIEWQANPLKTAPVEYRAQESALIPGGTLFYSGSTPPQIGSSAPQFDLQYLLQDIADVRERINRGWHADLFLMLANMNDTRMTATEVAERHEEKLLMLGPTIEQLHYELLKPLIQITFADMLSAGILPEAPLELNGMELRVNFISMLAQAQRAIQTNSIDRFVSTIGTVAAVKPEVLDKFDSDQWADAYADMLGVDPALIVADDEVALIRQTRAQQQAQANALAQAEQVANTASKAATVPTAGGNLATDVINQFSGFSSPRSTQIERFQLP